MIAVMMILFEIFLCVQNIKKAKEFMWRDQRLCIVSDTIYGERVYVDLKTMTFHGNDTAAKLSKDASYDQLYGLLKNRLTDESELPRLEAFLSPETVINWTEDTLSIIPERFMMMMQDKDGNMVEKTIEVSKMKFICDGRPVMSIAMRDASESVDLLKAALKETESLKEQEQKQRIAVEDAFHMAQQGSQAKVAFLSKMSHEIRTPLNAIIGYISIAKDSDGNLEKINHCLENSEIASKHLLQIINDVLDMSSIENES